MSRPQIRYHQQLTQIPAFSEKCSFSPYLSPLRRSTLDRSEGHEAISQPGFSMIPASIPRTIGDNIAERRVPWGWATDRPCRRSCERARGRKPVSRGLTGSLYRGAICRRSFKLPAFINRTCKRIEQRLRQTLFSIFNSRFSKDVAYLHCIAHRFTIEPTRRSGDVVLWSGTPKNNAWS